MKTFQIKENQAFITSRAGRQETLKGALQNERPGTSGKLGFLKRNEMLYAWEVCGYV